MTEGELVDDGYVYLLDTLSYEARGGNADAYNTLDGAMEACPWVTKWKHHVDSNGDESWAQIGSLAGWDIEEIRKVKVLP